MKNIVLVVCFVLAIGAALGFSILTDGTLDTSFDSDGKLIPSMPGGSATAGAVLVQPDGKILIGGQRNISIPSGVQNFMITRLTSSGAYDASFGTSGIVTTDVSPYHLQDYVYAMALQSDGKIVAVGRSHNGTTYDMSAARYTSAGVLDTSFNHTGTFMLEIDPENEAFYGVAVQPDGKIVMAGNTINGTDHEFVVVRLNTDGSYDTGFASSGIFELTVGSSSDAYAVALQSNGKIVVAGSALVSTYDRFAVIRLNTNGALDNTFGTSGSTTVDVLTLDDECYSVAVQADGKIVLAGYSITATNYQFAIVRLTSAGALDNTFDSDGKTTTQIGAATDFNYGYSVQVQLDGKIVVGGTNWNNTSHDYAVARYTSAGALDNTFNSTGVVVADVGSASEDYAAAMAMQTDGKIIVVGQSGFLVGAVRFTGSSGPLPVEMVSFDGRASGGDAVLQWKTASESNNYGFEVERTPSRALPLQGGGLGGGQWAKVGFVEGAGNSNSPRSYSFVDKGLRSGVYIYRLKQIDRDGNFKYTEAVAVEILVPRMLTLSQNYPNPFNPSTTIEFTVPGDGRVTLKVYDVLGKEVATLVSGELEAGVVHRATFDASNISSGIYFFRLEHNDKQLMKKLLVMK